MAEAKPGTEVFSSAPTNSFYGLRVQFLPPKSELEKASGVTQSNLRQHFPLLHKNSSPPPRVQASSRDQETAGSVLHRTETLALGRHLGTSGAGGPGPAPEKWGGGEEPVTRLLLTPRPFLRFRVCPRGPP